MTIQFQHKSKLVFFAVAIWLVLLFPAPAIALPCTVDIPGGGVHEFSNNVLSNNGCEQGTDNNDSENQLNIVDTLFGLSDWELLEKDEGGANNDGLLFITGNDKIGTWTIASSVFADNATVALIVKGGGNNTLPPFYDGYLVADLIGNYISPFINSNNVDQAISHYSLYGSPSAVPLPAALPLFGTGLGIMGFS